MPTTPPPGTLAEASDYATDIMTAFGMEATELDRVMDTMTATFTGHNCS